MKSRFLHSLCQEQTVLIFTVRGRVEAGHYQLIFYIQGKLRMSILAGISAVRAYEAAYILL
ncbi:hypothetical protein XBO1_1510021 [Xenorhabdus bovienii str. oregonense]|uniref:Uncharacterized protein n=1 Tax=Xenorhabdus bovienii str. oregonense TaxID=1398202 RepID=A0A077NS44_XENBV|nr:hypothetical protein XBO1_1510021 [Xenorhabdus bovienii str. oregonense]